MAFKEKVTLFVMTIVSLGSYLMPLNVYSSSSQKKTVSAPSAQQQSTMSADQVSKPEKVETYKFGLSMALSRSMSLVNQQDGSDSQGLEFQAIPSLVAPIGSFSAVISYARDLKDEESIDNGFADTIVSYGGRSKDVAWSAPYILSIKPTLTTVIPVSKRSRIKDQLQTALSVGLSTTLKPDGVTPNNNLGDWMLKLGVTGGRNFHTYEEDINGRVLNKYSSNQTINLGYNLGDWGLSAEYIHRVRWTYQGNIRESFGLSEELSYSINDHWGVAVGHSNEGPALKANGYESNFSLYDENTSSVYFSVSGSL